MSTMGLLETALFTQCAMDVAVLSVMVVRGNTKVFPHLGWLLATDGLASFTSLLFLYFRPLLHLDVTHAYIAYFFSSWALNGILLVLRVLAVYSVFAEAMRPMAGLHKAGKIIFRWVGVVSALVAFALLAGPGVFTSVQ